MDKNRTISITTGTILKALLILAGAYICWLLRDLALLVLTAIVIASAIEPGVMFFVRARIPRFLAVLLVYVLTFGSVFLLLYFFFPPIVADALDFLSLVPQYINTLPITSPISDISTATDLLGSQQDLQELVGSLFSLQYAVSASSGGVTQLLITFFGGILSFVLVVVLSF
jgi:predicted PurR-regulated permease PerM